MELKKGAILGTDYNEWVQYYESESGDACWIYSGRTPTLLRLDQIKPVNISTGLIALNFKPDTDKAFFPKKWQLKNFQVIEKTEDAFFIGDKEVKSIIMIQEAFNLYELIPRD